MISHLLVGASNDYVQRYFAELPPTFNPKKFDPDEIATLAKLAGMKYIMFTTKSFRFLYVGYKNDGFQYRIEINGDEKIWQQ